MRHAVPLLLLGPWLAGCVQPGPAPVSAAIPAAAPPVKIAALLPLTGPNAALGRDLLNAVQLALGPDGPQPDVRDTLGTPAGATAAAQGAVAAGDTLIIGPLTAPETAAVAAAAPGLPVLAFTSDQGQGRPGVWALGITPQQQAARLVQALTAAGKVRVAAVLPDNAFGNALANGLTAAATAAGDPAPSIKRYPNGRLSQFDRALKSVSDYAARQASAADQAVPDPDPAAPPAPAAPLAPPPFDSLLLAESGPGLRTAAASLAKYGVAPPDVQVVGPATWAREAANLGGLTGAWYAAPDPAARAGFGQAYAARFGSAPPGIADIAYDAAQLARTAAGNPAMLTQPGGFRGADGPFALRPDGQVVRGLAIFSVQPGGARLAEPAPSAAAPNS